MFFRFRRRLSAVRLMTCALSIFRKIYFINEAPEEDARITRQEKTRLCILCRKHTNFPLFPTRFVHYFLHRYASNCAMMGTTKDCIVTRSDLGGNLHTQSTFLVVDSPCSWQFTWLRGFNSIGILLAEARFNDAVSIFLKQSNALLVALISMPKNQQNSR